MTEEFLQRLIYSLNLIEVKGRDNMDALLGCIVECEKELRRIREEKEGTPNAEQIG